MFSLLLPLQFVPALVHVFAKPEVLFIVGLIILIGLSLIFGRAYCSFLCPLGILQDILIAVSRKIGLSRHHSFQKPMNWLRYPILLLTLVTAVSGMMALLNLLDPFSFFGRTITHLFEPLSVWLYNVTVNILKHFDIYVFNRKLHYIPFSIFGVTLGFFLLIAAMSFRCGRLYCNTLCPIGALLGLISKISVFKLSINEEHCSACGCCENVCKAGCIDTEEITIDQSRCINCFNCLEVCPKSLLTYRPFWKMTEQNRWSPARRGFLIGSVTAAGSILLLLNSSIRSLFSATSSKDKVPITPPGSGGLVHFTNTCTACHLCISACPTKVITPAFLEYGVAGLMQPLMNYQESYCDYECNTCGKICPTGAIKPLLLPEKKITQIGTAELKKERCIVYVNNRNCGACGEVCPTQTISFANKNNILYPQTDIRYCIGCGACEKVCPTEPKAIIIQSNPIHKRAIRFSAPRQGV